MLPSGCEPRCRGCSHRELSHAQSLAQKKAFLSRALEPWRDRIAPIQSLGSQSRFGYRSKVSLHAAWTGSRWELGLLRDEEVVAIPDCPVQSPFVNEVARVCAERLPPPEGGLPLRFVSVTGRVVTWVVKRQPPLEERGLARVREVARQLETLGAQAVYLHYHPSAGRKVFHPKNWEPLGEGRQGQFLFRGGAVKHGPRSFQQVLPELYEQAISEAERFLDPSSQDAVLDLYSGLGLTLGAWRARGARAIGVELCGEAAGLAMERMGPESMLRGRIEDRIPQLETWLGSSARRLAFVNPPRSGMGQKIATWLGERARPQRLAYLSCSPGTLSKDLCILDRWGYQVVSLQPFDFFPGTHHVETLATLKLS